MRRINQQVPGRNAGSWKHTRITPYTRVDRGGRITNPHRNRTLILKQPTDASHVQKAADHSLLTSAVEQGNTQQHQEGDSLEASSGWVSKRDRHMQLINSSIYGKDAQSRQKAIENTRRQKTLYRQRKEKDIVNRYLQSLNPASSRNPSATPADYHVVLEGLSFTVMNGGSKLSRDPGKSLRGMRVAQKLTRRPETSKSAHATPRQANIGGVIFYRSKNGNLYRAGAVEAKR